MIKTGDMPYTEREAYKTALNSQPDIVIIQLGTNDSKPQNWNEEQYIADYVEMAKTFMKLDSAPQVFFMVPPPLYIEGICHLQQSVINDTLPHLIPKIANKLGLGAHHIINNFEALGGHDLRSPELMYDGIHPNDDGYAVIAQNVFKTITAQKMTKQKKPAFHARL